MDSVGACSSLSIGEPEITSSESGPWHARNCPLRKLTQKMAKMVLLTLISDASQPWKGRNGS